MALRCGIIGIANVGKTTLFNCLSSAKGETSSFAFSSSKSNVGIINVPDNRLLELAKKQPTEKIVYATVEIVDIPGLTKGANKGEGVGNKFLTDIRNTDALIHVLRCFDDPSLPHIEGSVNPVRDIETISFELQVKDLESVEKKLERTIKMAKVGDKEAKRATEVLIALKNHLEQCNDAATFPMDESDRKSIDDLFLLSVKPVIYVCNVDEKSAVNGNDYVQKVQDYLKGRNTEILVIAAKVEAEIAELDDANDRKEFLASAGLSEPGVNKLVRAAYSILNLQSFFTVGPKEIRAWTIPKGVKAQQAAGVIHSDLERGFIRAEMMKYNDFIALGSEQKCKEAGKFYIEGKDYIVQDGDILHIRFNV